MKLDDLAKKVCEQVQDNDGIELRYLFIEQLQNYRKLYNLTQSTFAEKIGLKQQAIARFEKGEIDPRLSFISKILKGICKKIMFDNINYESAGAIQKTENKSNIIKFNGGARILSKSCFDDNNLQDAC